MAAPPSSIQLTGDASQDQWTIRERLIGKLGVMGQHEEHVEFSESEMHQYAPPPPSLNYSAPDEFSRDFRAKFQEATRAQRLRGRPATGSRADRGTQIPEIARKLGQEVFRPDSLSFATYIRMGRDSEIKAADEIIKNSTISRGWEVNGGDPEIREWFVDMFKRLPMNQVFEQVLSAFKFGSSFTFKRFEDITLPNGRPGIGIEKYKVLPPWTISLLMKRNGTILKVRQYSGLAVLGDPNNFDLTRSREGVFGDRRGLSLSPNIGGAQAASGIEDFGMEAINIFTFQPQFGNPFGESGLKAAYTDWVFKEHFLTFQAEYMQIMAGGAIIGTAGYGQVDEMRDELVQFSSSGVIALPDDQTVLIDRPKQTDSPFLQAIRYHDEQITKALLVPVLLMGQKTEFGSRSLGETHFELFKIVRIQKMQQDLSRWVQNDIAQLAFWNWGITDQSKLPKFTFKAWSTVDLEQIVNMLKKAAEMGLVFMEDMEWLRDIMEMPDAPEESKRTFFPVVGNMSGAIPTIGGRPGADERRQSGEPASAGSQRDKSLNNEADTFNIKEMQYREAMRMEVLGVLGWLKDQVEDGAVDLKPFIDHSVSASGKHGLDRWGATA